MCLPFVFGTTDIAKDFVGAGPEQAALTKAVMGAWIAFARSGNPSHAGLPAWTPYEAATRPTMVFDNACRLALDPKPDDLARINRCPPFVSDMQWPMAGCGGHARHSDAAVGKMAPVAQAKADVAYSLSIVARNDSPGPRLLSGKNTVAQLSEEARWQHPVLVAARLSRN
jgi:hypothetical protein